MELFVGLQEKCRQMLEENDPKAADRAFRMRREPNKSDGAGRTPYSHSILRGGLFVTS